MLLTWTAVPGAVRYVLLAEDLDSGNGWQQPIGGNNLTGTTYTHRGVAGRLYQYAITAVADSGVEGWWLAIAPVTMPGPTPTP